VRFFVDTEFDSITLDDGTSIGLEFLKWFLNQPKGTIVQWEGKDVKGQPVFTTLKPTSHVKGDAHGRAAASV
jgi:hypothetical protein